MMSCQPKDHKLQLRAGMQREVNCLIIGKHKNLLTLSESLMCTTKIMLTPNQEKLKNSDDSFLD